MKRPVLALLAAALLAGVLPASSQVPRLGSGIQITASSGNVAAATATATLAAAAGRTTYICGFAASAGGATAAAVVNLTVTGIVTGTMTFTFGGPAGAGVPAVPLVVPISPCQPANAPNTTIVVSMPTLGTGNTNASVNAWGEQR